MGIHSTSQTPPRLITKRLASLFLLVRCPHILSMMMKPSRRPARPKRPRPEPRPRPADSSRLGNNTIAPQRAPADSPPKRRTPLRPLADLGRGSSATAIVAREATVHVAPLELLAELTVTIALDVEHAVLSEGKRADRVLASALRRHSRWPL